jgi:hypothetical protein
MKRILSGIMVMVLMMSVILPITVYADADATFTLVQDSSTSASGQQIVLVLKGENLKDMYAYEAVITFDQEKLEFVKSTAGMQGFSVPPKMEGNKMYVAFTKVGNVKGVNGSATLNTITFRGKASGNVELQLESVKVVDSALASKMYTIGKTVKAAVKGAVFVQDAVVGSNKLTATANLTLEKLNSLLSGAESDKSGIKTILLEINPIKGVIEYVQKLPASALTSVKADKYIVIRTPNGNIRISGNMLTKAALNGSTEVSIVIKAEDRSKLSASLKQTIGNRPLVGLHVLAGTKIIPWNNPLAPVTVTLPYTPTSQEVNESEHIVVLYIDDKQNTVTNSTGRFNTAGKNITFSTTHFSQYAVAYVHKSFSDTAKYSWAKKQIEVLASKGIIGGISDKNFGPALNITRADFVSLLVRTMGLTTTVDSNYQDVTKKDYFYNDVGIAKKLGITPVSGNSFKPRDPITRQDMMVFTAAALKYAGVVDKAGTASELAKFTDKSKISPNAVEGAATVVKMGIITGSNNLLNPQGKLSRAEAAIVIYKVYNLMDNE